MNKLNFAKQLRSEQTEMEKILWFHLRAKRLNGIKFKRQQIIGNYIVDFVSFEKMLIVELDGGQHNDESTIDKDQIRTSYLESVGFTVLRFWNNDVFNHLEIVLELIVKKACPSL